jgi:hypothetical protein
MSFRLWCYHIWNEHIEEVWQWQGKAPTYNSTEYFHKYKWWLKREFLHKKISGEL